MGKAKALKTYRVLANVGTLRHGETVEIDPTDEGWASFIAGGFIVPTDTDTAVDVELDEAAGAPDAGA